MIQHLLSQEDIDVNLVNSAGLTPLDVLLVTNHEIGDLILGEMIRAFGGKTAKEIRGYEADPINSTSVDACRTSLARVFSTPSNQVTRATSLTKAKEDIDDRIENLIVVAALIATVTFASALNPPGGSIQIPFNNDDRMNSTWLKNWKQINSVYPAGSPVYLWKLKYFYVFDSLALLLSISVILLCLCGIAQDKLLRKFMVLVLWLSMSFMVVAFSSALTVLLNSHQNTDKFQWFNKMFYGWEVFFFLICVWLFVRALSIVLYNGPDWLPSWIKIPCAKVYQAVKWTDRKMPAVCIFVILFLVGYGIGWGIGKGVTPLN